MRKALEEEQRRSEAYQLEIHGLRRALHDQKQQQAEDAASSASASGSGGTSGQAEAGGMSALRCAKQEPCCSPS